MKRKTRLKMGVGLAVFGLFALLMNWSMVSGIFAPLFHQHAGAAAFAAASAGLIGLTTEDKTEIETLLTDVAKKHREAIKTEIGAAIQGLMTLKEFGERLDAVGIKEGIIKQLTEAMEKQGEEMRKILAQAQEKEVSTVERIVEASAEAIKGLFNQKRGAPAVKIVIPRASIQKTLVQRSAVSGSTMAMRLNEIGQLPYLGMKMTNLFRHAPVSPSSNGVIRYYDQAAITRAAAPKAEGAAAPESVITWVERLLKIEKIMDSIPVTKEAWNDIYFIQSELDRLLNINLALKEDQQLWSGTGVSPELLGVYTGSTDVAAELAAAPYANSVQFANIYDLVAVIRVVIMNAKQSKYTPNVVVMNPADILAYKLTKDQFGRYVLPPFIDANGSNIDGCSVIESSQVDANTLLVGDTRYGTIYDLDDITVEMGYINDQFVKDGMTMLAEKREALLIRTVDYDGFRKCTDITAALALIAA